LATKEGTKHQVTVGKVHNVTQALASLLAIEDVKDQPLWLGEGSRSFLAVENGLLDLDSLLKESSDKKG
jgi:hypothetical protein